MKEEELENKNLNIVWINGEALIDLSNAIPPRMQVRFIRLTPNGDPFKQMLDEIKKFMGGFSDADKKK